VSQPRHSYLLGNHYPACAHAQQGVKQSVCMSICLSVVCCPHKNRQIWISRRLSDS
jgi:hypothetical protein